MNAPNPYFSANATSAGSASVSVQSVMLNAFMRTPARFLRPIALDESIEKSRYVHHVPITILIRLVPIAAEGVLLHRRGQRSQAGQGLRPKRDHAFHDVVGARIERFKLIFKAQKAALFAPNARGLVSAFTDPAGKRPRPLARLLDEGLAPHFQALELGPKGKDLGIFIDSNCARRGRHSGSCSSGHDRAEDGATVCNPDHRLPFSLTRRARPSRSLSHAASSSVLTGEGGCFRSSSRSKLMSS